MFPPHASAVRQSSAHPCLRADAGFAIVAGFRDHSSQAGAGALSRSGVCTCYPFPSPGPDPDRVRPFSAETVGCSRHAWHGAQSLVFSCAGDALMCGVITTRARGSHPCVNLRSFLPSFWPCPLRAARAIKPLRPNAPWAAPLQARLSRTRPAAAKPPARLSARLRAACHAAFRACRAAADLTRPSGARRSVTHSRTTRASCPGGLFVLSPALARAHQRES